MDVHLGLDGVHVGLDDVVEAKHDVSEAKHDVVPRPHDVSAGLIDQYTFAHSELALTVVTDLAGYFYGRIQKFNATVGRAGWQRILEAEWGGMNEAAYNIFEITQDQRHREIGDCLV